MESCRVFLVYFNFAYVFCDSVLEGGRVRPRGLYVINPYCRGMLCSDETLSGDKKSWFNKR